MDDKGEFSKRELIFAKETWYQEYEYKNIDELVGNILEKIGNLPKRNSWLKEIREAYLISQKQMGILLGITQQAYAKMELREDDGKIEIGNLQRVAEKLQCDLVYFLIPKDQVRPSEKIWNEIFASIENHPRFKHCRKERVGFVLGKLALARMRSPRFRRLKGWARLKCRR